MNITVIDRFKRHGKFGFVLQLSVPEDFDYYSILIEYPRDVFAANFQTWNLNFFGFYEKFVLLHSKRLTERLQGDDIFTHSIVIENLETSEIREFNN